MSATESTKWTVWDPSIGCPCSPQEGDGKTKVNTTLT